MTETTHVVFLHSAGQMPDVWAPVVNVLPAGWKPWLPNLALETVEQYLDKQELRDVVLVGHGTGALSAVEVARTQPHRVSHLAVSAVPDTRMLTRLPAWLLRRRGVDKQELLATAAALRDLDVPVPAVRVAADPAADPAGYVAAVQALLA